MAGGRAEEGDVDGIGEDARRQLEDTIQAIADLAVQLPSPSVAEFQAFLQERPVLQAALSLREFRLRPFLQEVVEKARGLVGAGMAALGVGTDPGQPFLPWIVSGAPPDTLERIGRPPCPVGILGVVAREGRMVCVPDVRLHPAFLGLPEGHPEVTSFLGVPIRYKGVAIGNLYVAYKRDGEPFSDEDGCVLEVFATHAAVALAQSLLLWRTVNQGLRFSEILKSAPDGLLYVDAATHEVEANLACDRLFGVAATPGAGVAQYTEMMCWPDGRPMAPEEHPSMGALAGRSTAGIELQIRRPDRTVVPIWKRAEPVRDPAGRVVGAVVAIRDLTLAKELERLREQFAAMVAHDLRNPIQTILVQIGMLRRPGTTLAAYQAGFDRIERSAQRLGQMTHDLLDAARIELSEVKLSRRPVDVGEAVRVLVEHARPSFGERTITVEVAGTPGEAWIDPPRLDQIVANLLDNAAKYSPSGSPIEIRVSARDEGIEVAVVDHGMGIPEEEMGRLFDRFYQGRRAREGKSGLGLGLHIVRGLVEAHGGRIDVESRVGAGSTFRVWFPSLPPAGTGADQP